MNTRKAKRKLLKKTRKQRQKGGECPPGMPPKVCEKHLQRLKQRGLTPEQKGNIKRMAHYLNFKRQSNNEKQKRLQNSWEKYKLSRYSLSSSDSDNIGDENEEVHTFDPNTNI